MIKFGCIADDFTGATDIASVLAQVGRSVVVVFRLDAIADVDTSECDALVLALKSRTAPVKDCIQQIQDAAGVLKAWGADRFYLKYCSTFDSTHKGNIGPSIDTLLEELDLSTAVVAPAYPDNGRTVYQGHLFVGHDLLDESPMRNHPLTPMHDSSIERLLAPQTHWPVSNLYLDQLHAGVGVRDILKDKAQGAGDKKQIIIADAVNNDDLRRIAASCPSNTLLTGGAGLAIGLGSTDPTHFPISHHLKPERMLIVSGSASAQARRQVRYAKSRIPSLKIDTKRLLKGDDLVLELMRWVRSQWEQNPTPTPVLVYATDSLEDLSSQTTTERKTLSERIESTLAGLAEQALSYNLDALLVAGGETSGKVVQGLGITAIHSGIELDPGVIWAKAKAKTGRDIFIALKSGNFGSVELYTKAWERLQ